MPSARTSSNSLWDNPWIISSVAIVCTFTLIFTYYKLLLRLCRRLHGTSISEYPNQRRILNEINPDDPSLQFQSQGLDFSIMQSLPVTQFKKQDEAEPAEHNQSNTDCAVCLGEFEEGEWLKQLPKCAHEFHISCIDTWFVSHSNCPLCRSQVYDFMNDYVVPMDPPLEMLGDDAIRERALHYQMLRFAILERSPLGRETRNDQ